MKVVVTGATGFLGGWVARQLVKENHQVHILVRKNSNYQELQNIGCIPHYGDVTDPHSVVEALHSMDAAFHLAGVIAYKKSELPLMEKVNVMGTQYIVQACKDLKIPRLVHLSSVTAIGASFNPNQILNENSEYNVGHLQLGYFETKRKAELIVKKACAENLIDAVILNPSTIYGSGDAQKGSRKTQVKVAKGKFPFYTQGGVNVVAVESVVEGIISAWQKGRTGERYILAGENLLIKDLFQIIAESAGVKPPSIKMPTSLLHVIGAVGDQLEKLGFRSSISSENAWTASLYHWFDASKAQKELGFKSLPARHAIQASVQWMKDNGYLKI